MGIDALSSETNSRNMKMDETRVMSPPAIVLDMKSSLILGKASSCRILLSRSELLLGAIADNAEETLLVTNQ